MIRILQVVNVMDRAGLETMLMNYYRNIDRMQVQFDFLTHRPDEGAYDAEIRELGGIVYHAPRLYPQNYPAYFKFMKSFFKEHPEYKIVHSHIDAMSAFPLKAAKDAGIPIRIAHSHSSKLDRDIKLPIKWIALQMLPSIANKFFACGELAGVFMFKKHSFKILNNAIDLEKFSFNQDFREKIRNEMGISEELVIGHVGRYCYIKNQIFLLEIFKAVHDVNKNSRLLLIGKGEDEEELKSYASKLKIDEYVSFLIDRNDVNRLYNAMDIFVMPSLFEGLPLVLVEAQANGLPCIMSDKVSEEAMIIPEIRRMSLETEAKLWAKEILETKLERNINAINLLTKRGYSIKTEVQKLEDLYKEYMEK